MSDFINSIFFRNGEGGLLELALWFSISSLIILLTVNAFYWEPQFKAEKAKLTIMSCKDLGQWLIDNSNRGAGKDVDTNYSYAEAKYLVCTHTPLGVTP